MTLKFQLDEQDFLEFQWFIAAQIPKIKRLRLRRRLTFPIFFIFLGFLLLTFKIISFAFILWFLAIIWFTLYPFWHNKKYRKHYLAFVNQHYSGRFGKEVYIDIRETKIIGLDNGREIKLKKGQIEEIIETPTLILIQINEQQYIIIPKSKVQEPESLIKLLKDHAEKWEVSYSIHK